MTKTRRFLTESEVVARERRRVKEIIRRAKVANIALGPEDDITEALWQEAIDAYKDFKKLEARAKGK